MAGQSRVLASVLALGLVACDSTGTGRQGVSLSFSTQAPVAAMTGSPAASFDITQSSGTNTLIITRAQMVLRELELKQSVTTTCAAGTAEDACEELQLGPTLIDLPVTDGLLSPISTQIPAGTYHEIEFDIRRPGTDPADQAFVAANPNFANASIRLEGTFNGTPFVFTSQIDQEVQIDFNPPVVVADGTNNVTIAVDLRSWFRNADGSLINPTTANPGQANAGVVSERIKLALRAFEDDDRNGH